MKNKLRISLLIAMAFLALLMISCRKKQEPQVEQGFDEDTHYLISYESNGDGTCYVSEIRTDPSYSQSFVLEIPKRSPAGDIVTEIRCEPFEIHLPELLSEKDYEEILTKLEQARDEGKITTSDITCFTSSYKLISKGPMRYYPIVEVTPVYVGPNFDAIPPYRRAPDVKALRVIMTHADYTLTDLKEDYDYLHDLVEQSDSENKETILESLPKIEENYGSYISEIKLPDTVKAITTECFYASCPFLTSVDLPDSLTTIPENLFYDMLYLESVSIPDGVEEIGASAFYSCDALSSVVLPESLRTIGAAAFYSCDALSFVVLPESLRTIGAAAFYHCVNLERVTVPSGLTRVGSDAFLECKALRVTAFDNGYYLGNSQNPYVLLFLTKGEGVISLKVHQDTKVMIDALCSGFQKLTKVVFLGDLSQIPVSAFRSCTALRQIDLPDGLTAIGASAFYGCRGLTEITIPAGVTVIENSTFLRCESLTKVTLSENVTRIGEDAFYECERLSEIALPKGLVDIGERAFMDCRSLTEVIIPGGVTSLEYGTFSGCTLLKKVVLSENFTTIGESAFSHCSSLETLALPNKIESIGFGAFYASGLKELTIPESVKRIERLAFSDCGALERITIPSGVSVIEWHSFQNCTRLFEVVISHGVERIEQEAFLNCTALTSVSVPSSLVQMDGSAFDGCEALESTYVYDGVYYLGNPEDLYIVLWKPISRELQSVEVHPDTRLMANGVFKDCTELVEVRFHDALKEISNSAFEGCKKLSKVTLSGALASIGNDAFSGCDRLTSLVLPRGLNTLGDDIFYRSGFHVVYYGGNAEEWSKISLGDNPRLKSVKVYFYSESQPDSEGNYWHYVDGIPVAW